VKKDNDMCHLPGRANGVIYTVATTLSAVTTALHTDAADDIFYRIIQVRIICV
jgi:hypothetical protein